MNKHYLDKVIELAEQLPVIATEDIYDARGNKLLAKGAQVSHALQEKLILHKLTKPIEASLRVTGGVDANLVVKTAERLLEENPALQALVAVSQGNGPSAVAMLARLQFGNAVTMMLTIAERGGNEALDHAVAVAITATCFAKQVGLSPELQQSCALAGLLHDIGELYVDPAYLAPGRQLQPHEWAHLVVHPRTGQMLIAEHEAYAPEVSRAVAEHHERLDGSGYPRRLSGDAISPCGQVLAAAEAVNGMLRTTHALEHAEVALKLITSEHDRRIASAVSRARKLMCADRAEAFAGHSEKGGSTHVYGTLVEAIRKARTLAASPGLSQSTCELLDHVAARLMALQRAALSSGLDMTLLPEGGDGFDGLMVFEHAVATREIGWRMRELSREMALAACTVGERAMLAPLDAILNPLYPTMEQLAA